ncbi:TolC family protein [Hydrogenobacter hydrogenophilus]|uniref:Outer membrane protein, cobalt-zinc-cadmium efflux system n=1 Tax=Hydrogenobacter hydrogenophilus TaxID=35835 RepID=A0A285NWY1_9AQUI|nr:TolC family protein [Hydrogenobacter hydrogenophilus]SNZ13975.1 outer membrane protein, cobalt-zinc-cadmium efflux system [Hydrogenobacter hydrogenophilus]
MKFIFVLLFVSFAFSEEISLFKAIKLLRDKNYDFKISLYEIKKSEGAYLQAGLFQNPTLSVNYTGLNFGKNILYDTGNTLLSARIDQPIELGGKREYRKLSAMYQLRSVGYQSEDLLRTLSLGLVSAYFQALSDRAYLEYIKQDMDEFEKILKIQEQKQKLGFLSLIELIKLQLYKTELEKALTQAMSNYKKDLKDFSFYLGGEDYEPTDVKDISKEANLEELIQRALKERESLKALKEQLRSVDYQIRLLKAYSIPDISVGVEYDAFGVKYKPGLGFGVSVSLPLFDRRQGDLLTAMALREQILTSIKREEGRIRKELSQAYEDYIANKKIYNNYTEKKQLMDELLERTKKAYLLGGISTLDFLDTLRTYRAFMNAFFQARYQYLQSYYTLEILGVGNYEG